MLWVVPVFRFKLFEHEYVHRSKHIMISPIVVISQVTWSVWYSSLVWCTQVSPTKCMNIQLASTGQLVTKYVNNLCNIVADTQL